MLLVECAFVLVAVFLAFTVPGTGSHFFERFEKENRGSTAGGLAQILPQDTVAEDFHE